ncbi:MAG TPA: MmcQ/YjbR family DNA-binding protein [Steroidobacteraceae bacterium]|nr:MmcQ/YjbR family DNA-binding protein [Steroidobacteraceae bacterium]
MTTRRKRGTPAKVSRGAAGTTAPTNFDDVREIAHALPGVVDGTSYGTPALKVGGKLIARVHQNMDCLVLRTDLLGREILMQSAPDAFFITDHYRDYPWILVRFGVVEKRALPDLIERAWRLVASKTLVKKYDGKP